MPDIVTNVLYQEIDRLQEKVKELEAALKRETNDYIEASCSLAIERDEVKAENKRLCKRIAELEAENHRLIVQRDGAFERWKSAIAKYPNGADGCCCLFDDNENQVQWCTPHAELRDENDALTAERDKLLARVKELEAERDADRRREYGYSQQTVDALTLERDKLRAERNDWKARYQSVSEMHDALIAEFNEMRAENKRLAALNDMFPQEIARLEDRVSAEYEAERADDRARIKELEAENKRLQIERKG